MKIKKNKISQSFVTGSLLLTSSIFIVKIFGIFFRFFVTNLIGPMGSSYFSVAYEIYNLLFALSTAGLPIAISRMVSENMARGRFRDVRQVHKVSLPIFLLTGSVGCILMLVGAFVIPTLPWVNVPGAVYSILALSPTILFACLMSIYRGYHQGLRDVVPTAVSEIIEASCKVIVGSLVSYGIIAKFMSEYQSFGTVLGTKYQSKELAEAAVMPFASAGAILGISIGAGMGYLYLVFCHKRRGDGITNAELESSPSPYKNGDIIRKLVKTAAPIGMGAIIMQVAGIIDMTFILARIQHIMATKPAELLADYGTIITPAIVNSKDGVHGFLLGCYTFTLPLMMLVPAITQSFGVVSLPAVTRAYTKKDKNALQKSIESVMKMTAIVVIPAGIGLAVLGPSLLKIIFSRRGDAVEVASNIVPILGIATIFISANMPVCSMLQAIGRVDLPVKIISFGLLIKVIVNYILVGIPKINIQGAGIGTMVGYGVILTMAVYFLSKETDVRLSISNTLIKPLTASLFCGVTAFVANSFLSRVLPLLVSVMLSIMLAVIVYILVLILIKAVDETDLKYLPKGEKIAKIFKKLKLD